MLELANCVRCGSVFARDYRDICPNCHREEERSYQMVYQYLRKRENRQATIQQITEATTVPESLIIKFVREKRLQPSQFPMLSYSCRNCSNQITEGEICTDCKGQMRKDLDVARELDEKRVAAAGVKEQRVYYNANRSVK
ncbi:TIGR03826 family flagellar region protein [Terribacillus saccharophilus]|uniref:TIGR03826 family flagellar region protein n=1 Tax=Terribacillus saccharophilus TaxID=361277 RepID=UPI003981C587